MDRTYSTITIDRGMATMAAITALLALGSGCGELRTEEDGQRAPRYTYQANIAPLLKSACATCHTGATAKGGYDLSTWRGLLGPGSDLTTRNAIPGDSASKLITALDSGADHKGVLTAEQRAMLTEWVVQDRLAYSDGLYHPATWLHPGNRNSKEFHGGELRAKGWDTGTCKGCHGSDLKGGKSGKSCETCHSGGTDGCGTCHGKDGTGGPPPDLSWGIDPKKDRGAGAHAAHAAPVNHTALACAACHKVPGAVNAAGHLPSKADLAEGKLSAEVTFGTQAALGGVTPAYDSATGTCTVYCHGVKFDKKRTPTWTAGITKKCDTCHTIPAAFGGLDCSNCHPQSVTSCTPGTTGCLATSATVGVKFIDPALHMDGKYPLGKKGAEGTCYGCHGTKASAGAPAPDLSGSSDTKRASVGLHAVHLAKGTYRDALPCTTCHTVPAKEKDKGHYDSALPAEVIFDKLASGILGGGSGTSPKYDSAKATCDNVHCHALDSGKVGKSWKWTEKLSGGLACDSCHGNPPAMTSGGSAHSSGTGCIYCHASAYQAGGSLDLTKHLNGKVDL